MTTVTTKRMARAAGVVALTALLAACASGGRGAGGVTVPVVADPAPIVTGTMRPYQIRGQWYRPAEDADYEEVGMASWYGAQFQGRPTASGERFDMNALTAAHKTLPLPGLVEVTNLANGRSAVLRLNDRGPFSKGRIIDLSRAAADTLGLLSAGVGEVRVRYLGRAPRQGGGQALRMASTPVAPPAVAEPDRTYWVQAGSFLDPLAARLSADGIGERASVRPVELDGRRWFRVLVGPWGDVNSAERERQAVMARGHADALLVSAP